MKHKTYIEKKLNDDKRRESIESDAPSAAAVKSFNQEAFPEKKKIESYPKWIYGDLGIEEYDTLFRRIERALGFRLFFWQKYLVVYGHYRRTGETTARALRELLAPVKTPIVMVTPVADKKEWFYRKELLEIRRKLKAEGIPVRRVIQSKAEYERYMEGE